MQGQSASPPSRFRLWWAAALILGLSLACYWPALRGSLIWDDDAHITRPELRSAAGLWQIWTNLRATQQYYPLLHSAFWIEHGLWGDADARLPPRERAAARRGRSSWSSSYGGSASPGRAWPGSSSPSTRSASNPSPGSRSRRTPSRLVFYLLAALAYLRFDGVREKPAAGRAYLLAIAPFRLALLTKTVTATLPAALLVVFWWQRGRLVWRRDVAPLVPWFVARGRGRAPHLLGRAHADRGAGRRSST